LAPRCGRSLATRDPMIPNGRGPTLVPPPLLVILVSVGRSFSPSHAAEWRSGLAWHAR
jgi:hypothetical protein